MLLLSGMWDEFLWLVQGFEEEHLLHAVFVTQCVLLLKEYFDKKGQPENFPIEVIRRSCNFIQSTLTIFSLGLISAFQALEALSKSLPPTKEATKAIGIAKMELESYISNIVWSGFHSSTSLIPSAARPHGAAGTTPSIQRAKQVPSSFSSHSLCE